MKKIKVLFLDVENCQPLKVVEIDDQYTEYLKLLRIDCFDIVRRKIAGKEYQIVCDDEALWKDHPICAAEYGPCRAALYGNLIITGLADSKGELTSLKQKDIERIAGKQITRTNVYTGKKYTALKFSE